MTLRPWWRIGLRAGLLIALSLLAACEPEPDVEPLVCTIEEPGIATLGLGDQSTGFLDVEEGSAAQITLGPQGLHMIVVSVRLEAFEMPRLTSVPTGLQIGIWLDEEVVGGVVEQVAPSLETADFVEFLGIRSIITVEDLHTLDGQMSRIEVEVIDGCGRAIVAERSLELHI